MRFPVIHTLLVVVGITIGFNQHCMADDRNAATDFEPEKIEFFERHIRPLLVTHCFECHSVQGTKIQAGLLVDSRSRLLKGGDSGSAIIPSDAEQSLLIAAVRYESYEMPPKGKLDSADIDKLVQWVNMGAPWPKEPEPSEKSSSRVFDLQARKQSHWMWSPIRNPQRPSVADTNWPKQDLDYFILSKLEKEELVPAKPVDQRGLLRRLSFDLTGLPPTPEQLHQYGEDASPEAIDAMVNGLLQSPRFGERWGRHWLDLVRYAETRGHEFDADTANAYQYRDYVIRALNADVPYDQLVREHIAGDLLPQPRMNPDARFNESILGTGFWFLGEWVHSPVDVRKDESDRFDNMIDVMSKTFLGVTVSCARCHDHKFDAISTRDYYSLTGFLQGCDYRQARFATFEKERTAAVALEELDRSYSQRYRQTLVDGWTQRKSLAPSSIDSSDAELKSVPSPLVFDIRQPLGDVPDSKIVLDYTAPTAFRWTQDGFIYGQRAVQPGALIVSHGLTSPAVQIATYGSARNDPFWNGLYVKSEAAQNQPTRIETLPRPGRTLRTPSFQVEHGIVSCWVRGSGSIVACVDSHRLVAGPLHSETIVEVKPDATNELRWVSLNLSRYMGHRLLLEFSPSDDVLFEVLAVRDGKAPYASSLTLVPSNDFDASIDRALQTWDGQQFANDTNPSETAAKIAWLLAHRDKLFEKVQPALVELQRIEREWLEARQQLRKTLPNESPIAIAMIDGVGEDDRVLIRGSSSAPGEITPRRFLEAIDGPEALAVGEGSGRLALAARINDPSNPLTSRVIVNRVWYHLMGRGIVPTVDDFGVLGQRPSHPELLDHLAVWFDEHGRSIKQLIRYIVLSRTYQIGSEASAKSLANDPSNLAWQYVAPKRLEGEAIRDSMLQLSGSLDTTMYGEPIPVYLTPFMDGRGKPKESGPLDGRGRRSIYLAVRRNFLSPFMLAFDTPVPFSTMGRRNVSNVPAQALIMMNDPLVVACAKRWAERVCSESSSIDTRLQSMYESAFARLPTENERSVAKSFIATQATQRGVTVDDPGVWTDYAHALLNLKEFIFLR